MAAQDKVAEAAQMLKSPDASVRASAMSAIVHAVAVTARPTSHGTEETVGNEIIPFLAQGLEDPDENVRSAAVGGLAMVAVSTERVLHPALPGKLDLTSYEPVRDALIKAMSDTNESVRVGAIRTYALSFKTTPEIEQKWINQFHSDQSEQVKDLILDAIVVGQSYSPQAAQFVVSQLQDPARAYQAAKAILLEMKPPPMQALPLIVSKLTGATDKGEMDMYVRAVGAYGEKARQYLGLLKQLLAKETDPVVKGNLQATIERISGVAKDAASPKVPHVSVTPPSRTPPPSPKPSIGALSTASPPSAATAPKGRRAYWTAVLLGVGICLVAAAMFAIRTRKK